MIVSYETLRNLTTYIANCEIGLLLCDEGHRLKNSGESVRIPSDDFKLTFALDSLTFQALNGLKVARRVILTGTPIQVRSHSWLTVSNINFCYRMTSQSISPY